MGASLGQVVSLMFWTVVVTTMLVIGSMGLGAYAYHYLLQRQRQNRMLDGLFSETAPKQPDVIQSLIADPVIN